MTENSYRFFQPECQYYPCHEGIEEMNCLFCYCPLYGDDVIVRESQSILRADGRMEAKYRSSPA